MCETKTDVSQQHTEGLDQETFQAKLIASLKKLPQEPCSDCEGEAETIIIESLEHIKSAVMEACPAITTQELQVIYYNL